MSEAPVPDTKNWTWVLRERCPECHLEVSRVRREAIPLLLSDNAASWLQVLQMPGVRDRPQPRVWSPLEYACHVRDVFRIFQVRLQTMLREDDPLFANWDQDETAAKDRYGEQDPALVAEELRTAADALSASFAGISAEQWSRTGRRSDGSAFTVESFGRYFIHDPVHHLWDVTGEPFTDR